MAASLGSLVVSLEANTASFTAGMDKAAYQTDKAAKQMRKDAEMVGKAIAAMGAVAAGAMVVFIKNSIDAADGMNDLSQRVGIAVSDLAKYELATNQSGTTMEALAKGIKGVARNLMENGKELAAAGITAKTADGALRQLADVFANMPDGIEKTDLAVKMFGKSGMDLIPMLNMGSKGLEDAAVKSEKYAAVMAILAPQADAFNDNLADLVIASKASSMSFINDMMPALIKISGAMANAAQESGILKATWAGLSGVWTEGWGKNAEIYFLKLNAYLDEANAKVMRLFGRDKESNQLMNAANVRYLKIQGMSAENAPVDPAAKQGNDAEKAAKKARDDAKSTADAIRKALGGGGKGKTEKTDAEKVAEKYTKLIAKLKDEAYAYGLSGAALLKYQMNMDGVSDSLQQQAMKHQTMIDGLKADDEIAKKRAEAQAKAVEEAQRAIEQNNANVENIRVGLMSELDQETFAHEKRLAELQTFHDAKLENVIQANALIEAENKRHEQYKADLQMSYNMQSLAMFGNTADMLYGMMQKSGQEQSALGKAAFYASKAIAVAEIILNTNVAASKAGSQLGVFGIPMAAMIMATGYAQAGMVAGMAIAGEREKGGPVWAGGAFIVGEKGPEIFKPSGHGTIIPNNQLGGGGGEMKLTIVNNTSAKIGNVTEQRISANERALIIQEAVGATAAQLGDPNSKTSRSMNRNYSVQRSR